MDTTRYSAPALEKGLDIIEVLADHPEGLSLVELARTLGRTTNEIFRMVVTLQTRGYLIAAGERYALSLLLFQLAHRHQPVRSLVSTALPLMTQLANEVRQSFHLCVYQTGRVIIVAGVESPERWGFSLKVGTLIGMTDTASGQVLMAFQDEAERERMLSLHVPVDGEIEVDPPALARDLELIRHRGFARMQSRQVRGVRNLAYPVFGRNGHAIASLTAPYIERIDNAPVPSIAEVGEAMKGTANMLTTLMGLNVYWEPPST
ncbi:IclR family transcriptional regulator [Paraburkholderia susongensis]|uniref:Transcriptional regulator, IclR family n=1 Tax=Paraburkholderia susongensis TaxID=1515439 RepID=A0A1X7LXR5_9BURK|nr:IclR family transcriptional regulator [Paraburkholderia susongensis]SMG57909.1 transcriptional regulator, IclR family [Paraburkholderia susongensis]